ncbi:hypothetical protein ACFSYH_03650 [Populibacterium corticicola]|uniref:Uncharacterized protein n=1 Tax=Populibacterium corticicola TaxID=1812826 RepID=A0ABW5XB40_9MICO
MRRLFWIGTGVALTVFVMVKGRKIVLQYTPEAVAERATAQAADFSQRATEAATGFLADFKSAFAEREQDLMSALSSETQGSVEDLRERRAAAARTKGAPAGPPPTAADFPDIDPEEQELGYSF